MPIYRTEAELQNFREQLHSKFKHRTEKSPQKGHPTWYGERFDLKEPQTWHEPSEVGHTSYQTQRGRKIDVTLTAWHNMLMRGSKALPAHQCPFTLLRIVSIDDPEARISPSKVQQDWNRIICQLGTPAAPPKPRVNPQGDNRDKLRLFVLAFQWLKRVSLGHLKLKLLPSF